ncbi:unnamed protein product [Somion occarium]|uniref:F-box domain-containing protein n=1 Tax=Somion occarium TaxID=3059160 RepID=A0ABP1EA85_9APHY
MFINPRTEEMNAVDDTGGLEMPLPEETTSHVDLEDHETNLPIAMRVHPIALRLIFETIFPPIEFLDPSLSFGPQSTWSQALRTQKALTHVCRSWRSVALLFLYQDIVFRRVGQIPALVRTIRSNREGIEELVKSITFACFIPEGWDELTNKNIANIMDQCPNIRSLSFFGPFVDWLQTSKGGTKVFDAPRAFKNRSHSITHLTYFDLLHDSTPAINVVPSTLLMSFPKLTYLSITSHCKPPPDFNHASPDPSLLNLSFPCLTHLDVLPKNGPIAMSLFSILSTWSLPSLTHLRMDLSLQWHYCTNYDHHNAFLDKFGPQLQFINFGGNFTVHASFYDGPGGDGPSMPVKSFVRKSANLGHLVMAAWDLDGVESLAWLLTDEFKGRLDIWVPSRDFVLTMSKDDSQDNPDQATHTTGYHYTHTLGSKYDRPNIRLLDQALAHIPNLPLRYPPDSIAKDDISTYVHRVSGLRFIQTRNMIVQYEEDWRKEMPKWDIDHENIHEDESVEFFDVNDDGVDGDEQPGSEPGIKTVDDDLLALLSLLPFQGSSIDDDNLEQPNQDISPSLSHSSDDSGTLNLFQALPFYTPLNHVADHRLADELTTTDDPTQSSTEPLHALDHSERADLFQALPFHISDAEPDVQPTETTTINTDILLNPIPKADSDSDTDSTYDPATDPYPYTESEYSDSDASWDSDDDYLLPPKDPIDQDDAVEGHEENRRDEGDTAGDTSAGASSSRSSRSKPLAVSLFERRGDVEQIGEDEAIGIFDSRREA